MQTYRIAKVPTGTAVVAATAVAVAATAAAAAANNMSGKSTSWVSILVLIGVAIAGYYLYINAPNRVQKSVPKEAAQMREIGDYRGVVAAYDTVTKGEGATADDKAWITMSSAGAKFHITGNIEDRLQDVRNLKQVAMDPAVSLPVHVQVINTLASQYGDSGRDPRVFNEMYKDPPFSQYLAKGDPELSSRHLYEWSYGQYPSMVAAVLISKWYSEQYVFHRDTLTPELQKEYAAKADEFLRKAEGAMENEKKTRPGFLDSTDYVKYRTFRAYIIGRLAQQSGEPYESQYRQEFDAALEFMMNSKNPIAFENMLFARFTYASEMYFDKDEAGSKAQLDKLALYLNNLKDPDSHGYVRFLRNTHTYQPKGQNWTVIPKLYAISPDFKAAVEHILATAPKEAAASSTVPVDGY